MNKKMNPKGIIFTGGPDSVYAEELPKYALEIFGIDNSCVLTFIQKRDRKMADKDCCRGDKPPL